MDKYEFNIKVEQIKKLVNKGDFETAMKIADTIDWKRVRNANLLSMIAQIYEKNEEYGEAKEILLLAFERAPIGKRLLYKLGELALKEGSITEAEDYYREFCDLAPEDPRQHLLRYLILKEKKAPADQLIHSLEQYTYTELEEKWLYELAELYHQADRKEECVKLCDKIMLMFGLGKYVDKAMELKIQYAPLTNYQIDLVENRDKYEAKLRAVEQEFGSTDEETEVEEYDEEMPYQTIDEELEASMHQTEAEEKLAEEITKISIEECQEAPELKVEEEEKMPMEAVPVEEVLQEEILPMPNHLMIESRTPQKGLEMAIEALRKIHLESGTKNQVVKISGEKLSKKGILATVDKLVGKDLIIEEAGDLSEDALVELQVAIEEDKSGMIVILIDNPMQMEDLHQKNPELASLFECIGVQREPEQPTKIEEKDIQETLEPQEQDPEEEMELDAFAEYACKYAAEIDCSITGKSMLALYEKIEVMEEDGIALTQANAEDMIEEAADRAEKPSLGRLITGVFSTKYDKEGLLILKEEHFID